MAGIWVGGGVLFRILEEEREPTEPDGGWPGVTILVAAYNEASVIGVNVRAARAVEYPDLEILVLDDGSTDETVSVAIAAAEGDERVEVLRDPVNRGKAERLNLGFGRARNELVVVTDADTHLHPLAVKLLVTRIARSPRIAAVAGAPHVTNRVNLLTALQSLEAASIIGLVRRTQALGGRTHIVAGVLAIFRRKAVIEVGGYDGRMATEDIDLTWRLLIAGWLTSYEPNALVGMQVPPTLSSLWLQRRRWARGQGEVLHEHSGTILHRRSLRIWNFAIESGLSLLWVVCLALALIAAAPSLSSTTVRRCSGSASLGGFAIALVVDPSARVRRRDRGPLRPTCGSRLPPGPALPPRLLGHHCGRRASGGASGALARPARGARRLGRSARARVARHSPVRSPS